MSTLNLPTLRFHGIASLIAIALALAIVAISAPAAAQQQAGVIELDTIEIESEVPRRVAQFFVQRDQLQYQHLEEQPTFIPELMESVEDDPF